MAIKDIFKRGWNLFSNKDPTNQLWGKNEYGINVSTVKTDRHFLRPTNARSIMAPVINRIANDCSEIDIYHCRVDDEDRYVDQIKSGLNNCLTLEANIDQTALSFKKDLIVSLLDEGDVAVVPVDADININDTNSFDILSLRVGKIVEWRPQYVRVNLYNEKKGVREDVYVRKDKCAIIENPLWEIMNAPNSTLTRLKRKLNLLDNIDEQNSEEKLDLIVQLPYQLKTPQKQKLAKERKADIEDQLANGKYGIAYIDGTERVIQLNRPATNGLNERVKELEELFYAQLGLTQSIFDGTADEQTMTNYYSRTIEPIIHAICLEFKRKFLTKTARSQGQSIKYFRDPFKLVPVTSIPDIADKLTRNEIASSNEIRAIIGWKPSKDPSADELRNKNLNQSENEQEADASETTSKEQSSEDSEIQAQLDVLLDDSE